MTGLALVAAGCIGHASPGPRPPAGTPRSYAPVGPLPGPRTEPWRLTLREDEGHGVVVVEQRVPLGDLHPHLVIALFSGLRQLGEALLGEPVHREARLVVGQAVLLLALHGALVVRAYAEERVHECAAAEQRGRVGRVGRGGRKRERVIPSFSDGRRECDLDHGRRSPRRAGASKIRRCRRYHGYVEHNRQAAGQAEAPGKRRVHG